MSRTKNSWSQINQFHEIHFWPNSIFCNFKISIFELRKSLELPKMQFQEKNDLFDFTSFFGLDFFKFSGPRCEILDKKICRQKYFIEFFFQVSNSIAWFACHCFPEGIIILVEVWVASTHTNSKWPSSCISAILAAVSYGFHTTQSARPFDLLNFRVFDPPAPWSLISFGAFA